MKVTCSGLTAGLITWKRDSVSNRQLVKSEELQVTNGNAGCFLVFHKEQIKEPF